jgi:hypothetical protein
VRVGRDVAGWKLVNHGRDSISSREGKRFLWYRLVVETSYME